CLFCETPATDVHTFPYTTLFRSGPACELSPLLSPSPCSPRPLSPGTAAPARTRARAATARRAPSGPRPQTARATRWSARRTRGRSEEHTSELQSRFDLVCRLLLE